ncbi:MAG TPA: NAD(P) transhydrogenase subunit alpha [Thermoguttaceae bacterium]|nr:NAD(P) transhydrogenase subunit alpha [Thermoguttaceae bacterium]
MGIELLLFAEETVATAPSGGASLILLMTVFVLAIFVGVEIITKIPPTLHTPLMSGSNAISGISLVGAILATGSGGYLGATLGLFAVIMATINVVGGFLVTNRMLEMFRKKKK